MPKRTYQPKKIARKRKCGYRARAATKEGLKVLKQRKMRGRWKLTKV